MTTRLDDDERGLLHGILLIVFLKVVVVGALGIDAMEWYVWPWSWLAFAWMLPWIVSCFKGDD